MHRNHPKTQELARKLWSSLKSSSNRSQTLKKSFEKCLPQFPLFFRLSFYPLFFIFFSCPHFSILTYMYLCISELVSALFHSINQICKVSKMIKEDRGIKALDLLWFGFIATLSFVLFSSSCVFSLVYVFLHFVSFSN